MSGEVAVVVEPPKDDIDLVRARARMALPLDTVEQSIVKTLLPPQCSIWNNWRGMAWPLHLAGHKRDSEPWLELGRDGAAWTLIARAWRHFLADNLMPESDCPIDGLLGNW